MDHNELLFGLHELEGIGWKTIDKLLNGIKKLEKLLTMSTEEINGIIGDLKKSDIIANGFSILSIQGRLEQYQQQNIGFLTVWDERYPERLQEIAQPPWILYYRGDINLLKLHLIAMVGTRTPTAYGKKAAYDLSREVALAGFGIVSGLAKGIDSVAHWGAVESGGASIAVLGTAIDVIYPPENRSLYHEMMTKGLILSEYPIGTSSHPGMFPQRNRIISGISLGTVVVEAALRSGSLITADQALEESRDVFAVPGPISSPKSQGTLSLIKQGAKLVTSSVDIIEEYAHLVKAPSAKFKEEPVQQLTEEEQFVMQFISDIPVTLDELLSKSKLQFGHLHSVLLHLLIKMYIKQLPGTAYIIF